MHLFKLVFFTLLFQIPRGRITRSYGSSIFNFLKSFHTLFHNGYTNLYSHHRCMRVPFSTSLWSLVFLNISHSNKCEVISHCGFYFYFWWLVMWQVFPYTCWLSVYLLKIVCSDPLPIFNTFILLLSCMNSLYILNANTLSDIWLTNIFSNSIG